MSIRLQIAAMLFLMIQAVLFGATLIILLVSPIARDATEVMELIPWVVAGTLAVSIPLSWWLAPHLRARTWKRGGTLDILR